jgi:hypothetical protein
MCCLRYEHDFYVKARKRFPKEGRILVTAQGEEKVIAIDIFRERVTLRSSEGDVRVVPIADLGRELRQPAPFLVEPDDEPSAIAAEVHDDEVPDEADEPSPARTPVAEGATAREASRADGSARPGRRRGRRGGRRGRPGPDSPGSPTQE